MAVPAGLIGLVGSLILLYRWAEPSRTAASSSVEGSHTSVAIRMENADYANYVQGRKTWAVRVQAIDLQRLPGSPLADIQAADMTGIHDGSLYAPSREAEAPLTSTPEPLGDFGQPEATFRAQRGRYTAGAFQTPPAELTSLYNLEWQLKLMNNVHYVTRAGDRLTTDLLTILQLTDRRTRRKEQRILCDEGATMTHKDASLKANQIRYSPATREVECLGGVRGTFKEGVVQTERAFWSVKEQMLRCPDTATGVIRGMPFTAEGITIDLKQRKIHANRGSVELRTEDTGVLRLK